MKIKNHKLVGVTYIPSPNVSKGTIKPRYIVQHYTAGWSDESAIETFKNPRAKVSAQLIIGRHGQITQMVPFNRRAWHAGPSRYQGFRNLNSISIGIENVNIGYLRKANGGFLSPGGSFLTYEKLHERGYDPDQFVAMANPRVGSGMFYWPAYTEAQLEANDEIVSTLAEYYGIEDIVSHEEIDTRGWKTDPGPAFPMKRCKQLLNVEYRVDVPNMEGYTVYVDTASLNVRAGPSTDWQVENSVKRGEALLVIDRKGDWLRVSFDDGSKEGWVHGYYTERK